MKESFWVIIWLNVGSISNKSRIKAFSVLILFSLTLNHRTLLYKFWKKDRYFHCTGLLHSSKLVHLDAKELNDFISRIQKQQE